MTVGKIIADIPLSLSKIISTYHFGENAHRISYFSTIDTLKVNTLCGRYKKEHSDQAKFFEAKEEVRLVQCSKLKNWYFSHGGTHL